MQVFQERISFQGIFRNVVSDIKWVLSRKRKFFDRNMLEKICFEKFEAYSWRSQLGGNSYSFKRQKMKTQNISTYSAALTTKSPLFICIFAMLQTQLSPG